MRGVSVFAKLLIVFAISGLLINGLVFWALRQIGHEGHPLTPFRRHFHYYLHLLTKDLGSQPSGAAIVDLEQRLGISIRMEDNAGKPLFGQRFPPVAELENTAMRFSPAGLPIGRFQGRPFVLFARGANRYAFFGPPGFSLPPSERVVVGSIVTLSVILVAAWLILRRVLQPIRSLSDGMQRMSSGDLDFSIPVRGRDELSALVESFNAMTARIRSFIAARETLLADVSHELRSPLARMKIALELMDGATHRDLLIREVGEMEEMIALILDSARFGSGQVKLNIERHCVSNIIEQLLAGMPAQRHLIEVSSATSELFVSADLRWAKVALRNIVSNAIVHGSHASHTGDTGQLVEIKVSAADAWVEVCVLDRGPGMSQEQIEKAFDPFYRADPSRQRATGGVGLGLHLCRRIMEAQGGTVDLRHNQPSGIVAVLRFPLSASSSGPGLSH